MYNNLSFLPLLFYCASTIFLTAKSSENLDKSHRTSTKNLVGQPMSQSTVGFSISTKLFDDANMDVMKQSQLITNMLEQNSENAFSPQRTTSSSQPTRSCSPPFQSTSSGISLNSAAGSIG